MSERGGPGRGARRRLLPVVALAAPALVLFAKVLFAGETFVERDMLAYYRASRMTLVRCWEGSGGLPMWNPWFASGQPFAANPEHQLFHPLTQLFLILPFEWAFRLQVVVPVLLSGVAMGFLLVTLGRSRAAALFGALSWAWGGYLLSTVNLLPILDGVVAAPVLLAFVFRLARAARPGDVAGLAASLGWMALAGEPVLIFTVALAAPAALVHGLRARGALGARPRPAASLARRGTALAAALLLGLALGAATLLPGSLLFRKTVRAEGLPKDVALSWSLPPVRALELAVPRLLGHLKAPLHETYWGQSLYGREGGPFLLSLYPGLLALAAAAAAWARRPSAEHAWAATGLLGLLLATGRHGPLWPLARESLPLLDGFRYPEKLAFLVVLAVVVSGSAGFDLLLRRRRGAVVATVALLGAAAVAGAAFATSAIDLPALFAAPTPAGLPELRALARVDGLVLLATAAAGLLALLLVLRRGRLAGGSALTLLLAVDLTAHGPALLRSAPAAGVDAAPSWLRAALRRGGPDGRLFHLASWLVPRGESSWIYGPPMPAYWGARLALESDFDLTELAWSHRATETILAAARTEPALLPTILERRGVSTIVRPHASARVAGDGLAYPAGLASPLDVAFSAAPARPAFLAEILGTARDAAGWLEAVRALGRGAARAAILDGRAAPAARPGRGALLAFSSRPGLLEADVRCDGPSPCFLALTETWDEHWSARVGGAAAEVLRVDLSLMGVPVPPGRHAVRLEYDDPSVRLGAAVSGAAALAALGLALAGRRRR